MKTVDYAGEKLVIRFSYDPAVVAQVRCLPPGRRWVPEWKAWVCPAELDALTRLREWGFEILPDALKWEREFLQPDKPAVKPVDTVPGLKGKLYPFQAAGVGFLESRGGRGLIADEMGLGKTIQALAWLQLNPSALPAVVVCPASLKGNWEAECRRWTSIKPQQLSGLVPMIPECALENNTLYIINYDILGAWQVTMHNILRTVILDEVHYAKNSKTKRTKAVKALCKGKQHVIALSGTPIINRPAEFFTALNILAPAQFSNWWRYVQRYCDAKHNGYGWDTTGASNTDELHERAGSVMIRRLKADVLKDLPDKQQTTVPLTLERGQGMYDAALREAQGRWQDEKPDPLQDITQIAHLRQAVVEDKLETCCEWIDNFLESGKKLVVWVVHHKTSDLLKERYQHKALFLDGRVDARCRSALVERFQTDSSVRMIIASIDVGGIGFTMTAAQDAAFLELPWTPGALAQAEDRIHRIGQKGAVNIYYLIAPGTLETDMAELLAEKRKVLNAVLDGKMPEDELSILPELKRRLKSRS